MIPETTRLTANFCYILVSRPMLGNIITAQRINDLIVNKFRLVDIYGNVNN